jgi:hypothetical protein
MRADNDGLAGYCARLGYVVELCVSMAKCLA